jgi:DNA-binding winged helix-turn-helix (wHTH) protein/TolB-like protein/Flp pilus assembly protein TadD
MQIRENNYFDFGKFRLDKTAKVLSYENEIISLPLKSVELLCLLAEKKGEIVGKNEIFDKVWQNSFVEDSVLTQNIYTLRKTFEEFGEKDLIKTVPRRGYIFNYENQSENLLTIEREINEEIEIIEENKTANQPALTDVKKNKAKYFYAAFALTGMLTATVFGYLFWSKNNNQKSLSTIKSIAVLPLKTLTETENEKILANGIREKLVSDLGNLQSLKILNTEISEAEIEKLTNFDAVLLGTLQQNEDKIRVNLRLLQTTNSEQIWAGTFNELQTDVFRLQDKISDEIVKSLSLNLSTHDREIAFKRETANREAYEQYLQGRYFFNQRGDNYSSSLDKAKPFFEKAIELDPNFAEAYIGLADVINLQTDSENKFDSSYDEGFQKSKELVSKALAINPNLAEGYATIGWIQYRYEWNFAEAEKSLLKALEINPNLPNVYIWLSNIYVIRKNAEKSIYFAEKAVELEPAFSKALGNLAATYAYNRQCEKAVELFPRIAQYMNNQGARLEQEGNILSTCGKCAEAVPTLLEAKKIFPRGRVIAYSLGYCRVKMNQPAEALEEIKILEMKPITGNSILGQILLYDALDEKEKALDIFEQFYKTKDGRNFRFFYDPRLENFRNESRFKEITKDFVID